MLLLLYVMWRFSEKRNPMPSRTTHNTTLEVLWTVVPVLILVAIAIPSFKLLYNQYTFPPPDLTIKAIGHTWNWTHEFPDQGISVDSVMLQDNERAEVIKAGMPAEQVPRNLAVDNEMLVPVNKVVHVLVTSTDVIHNWTIPSFGSKVDAVPGRVTATWFKATQGRHLLRPVLGAVRQGPRLHADRRARREGADLQRLGGGAEGQRPQEGARDHPQRGDRARGKAEGRGRDQVGQVATACSGGPIAHAQSRSLSGGADRIAKVGDMATKTHAEHAHGHDHEHTPYGIGRGGSIRPTTRTSARCTCCSPSWPA